MSENTEIYGGPYADEQDIIDAAFRDKKLDEVDTVALSNGALELLAGYKKVTAEFLPLTPEEEKTIGELLKEANAEEEESEADLDKL